MSPIYTAPMVLSKDGSPKDAGREKVIVKTRQEGAAAGQRERIHFSRSWRYEVLITGE